MENKVEYYTKSKDYYKKYYAEHKQELLAKQCAKVECKFCGKQVQKVNMAKHQATKLCLKRHEQNVKDEIRLMKDIDYYKNKKYGNVTAWNDQERLEFGVTIAQYLRYLKAEEQKENEDYYIMKNAEDEYIAMQNSNNND